MVKMQKKQLIEAIQKSFNEEEAILIEDINKIFLKEDESKRNQALLRAVHNREFKIKFDVTLDKIIRDLAVQITHYIFRNGTIEDLHAGRYSFANYGDIPPDTPMEDISQLTQANMKTLNKELVDKIGFLLHHYANAGYANLHILLTEDTQNDPDWDDPDIETLEANHFDYLILKYGLDKYLK